VADDIIVTCAPVQSLRNLPLKRLKEYLAAYNIPNVGPKEKEDFVQAIMKARNPQTGALSPEAEVRYLVIIRGRADGVDVLSTSFRPQKVWCQRYEQLKSAISRTSTWTFAATTCSSSSSSPSS
jgi:hypothetical protein